MKAVEITFTRKVTYNKIVKVSDALANRLLAIKPDFDNLIQGQGAWGDQPEDTEEVESDVYKADDASSDDFTLIAEDLMDARDVLDASNEIEDLEIREKITATA